MTQSLINKLLITKMFSERLMQVRWLVVKSTLHMSNRNIDMRIRHIAIIDESKMRHC